MGWDERRASILAEMGIRLWPTAVPAAGPAAGMPADPAEAGRLPDCLAERGEDEAGASQQERRHAPSAVDAMDWPALRAAVAACTACGLCESRRNTVFGVGHEHAQLMIVGEAPGEQEDRQGEPFVGKAGQLLDNMLRAIGLGRAAPAMGEAGAADTAAADAAAARQVFIANVLKCRPPLNRNPAPEEVAQCEPFLRRQVALVRPRVILAMGRFAVQSLLQSDLPVGRLRGRLHSYQGVPLVVTYHPAYLLRQPADKARAWDDLCLARAALRAAGAGGVPARSGA